MLILDLDVELLCILHHYSFWTFTPVHSGQFHTCPQYRHYSWKYFGGEMFQRCQKEAMSRKVPESAYSALM